MGRFIVIISGQLARNLRENGLPAEGGNVYVNWLMCKTGIVSWFCGFWNVDFRFWFTAGC
jgi:hypothetical protein